MSTMYLGGAHTSLGLIFMLFFQVVNDVENVDNDNVIDGTEKDSPPKYEEVAEEPLKYEEAIMKQNVG
jgi:hypothetical protein